jgi:hypothetical protein
MPATDPAPGPLLHERIPGEAIRLIEAAAGYPLMLRVTGSVAVRLHSGEHAAMLDALGRRQFRDIDFWSYSKQQKDLERLLEAHGYVADRQMKHVQEWGVKRLIYEHPGTRVHIDVFMDELVMAHAIDFTGRLELDSPTVPLADLLLSKLQIHEITENDLIDITVLLAEHDFGPDDRESIDLDRIAGVLRASWGFYYTTIGNIDKSSTALGRYKALPSALAGAVRERLGAMRDRIEAEPKSRKWKLRARVGTRAQWYETVEEVDR